MKKLTKRYKIREGSIVDIAIKAVICAGVWLAMMAILVPIYNAACAGGAI